MTNRIAAEPEYQPCKKCGSDNTLHESGDYVYDLHYVKCLDCGFTTQTYCDPYDAIHEWNERTFNTEATTTKLKGR